MTKPWNAYKRGTLILYIGANFPHGKTMNQMEGEAFQIIAKVVLLFLADSDFELVSLFSTLFFQLL